MTNQDWAALSEIAHSLLTGVFETCVRNEAGNSLDDETIHARASNSATLTIYSALKRCEVPVPPAIAKRHEEWIGTIDVKEPGK